VSGPAHINGGASPIIDYDAINDETRRLAGVVIAFMPPSPDEIELAMHEARAILDGNGLLSDREARARAAADVAFVAYPQAPSEPEDGWARNRASGATAAHDYRKARGDQVLEVRLSQREIERLHALLDDDVSLARAHAEILAHRDRQRGAASSTIEALMLSLRERGVETLREGATRQRLGQLSQAQLCHVGDRLQALQLHIARAWTVDEIKQLIEAWGGCR